VASRGAEANSPTDEASIVDEGLNLNVERRLLENSHFFPMKI